MVRRLSWLAAAVLLAGTAYELALALGAAGVGSQPGDAAAGAEAIRSTAFITMLLGVGIALVAAARGGSVAALLAPAAGLFVTAFFYTDDPYYAPGERRYSDGGAAASWWIFVVLVAALATGLIAWRRPREGATLTALMLLVCLATGLIAGDGH